MTQLTVEELSTVLQSDMKLWEVASTEHISDHACVKTVDLPYGIGEVSVTLEGMTDADKRRGAVGSYAGYIRDLIKDRTDDEAVEARAKQAIALAQQGDSERGVLVDSGGSPLTSHEEETVQDSEEVYQEDAAGDGGFGTVLTTRRAALSKLIDRAENNLTTWYKELVAVDAALAAMEEFDAPKDKGTPERSPAQ